MEWSRSNITAEEMERRQREYIEAAMNMAKKAARTGFSEPPVQPTAPQAEPKAEEQAAEIAGEAPQAEPKAEEQAAEIAEEEPQPEPKAERDEEKTTFGVFDKEELLTAAENGTVSGEGLKRAAEILAEMSDKTEEMRRVYGQMNEEREKPASQPQSLNGYVNRHNGGSCPKCGQSHNGSRR